MIDRNGVFGVHYGGMHLTDFQFKNIDCKMLALPKLFNLKDLYVIRKAWVHYLIYGFPNEAEVLCSSIAAVLSPA